MTVPGGRLRSGVGGQAARRLRSVLLERVERDHRQTAAAFRRRQVVTAVVVVIGAGVLAWGLNAPPDSTSFYVATWLLPVVWAGGAFASGPLHLGRVGAPAAPSAPARRPLVEPLAVGLGLAALFVAGALVVREITVVHEAVGGVVVYAEQGSGWQLVAITAVNGVAEELFFRGALYAAIPGRHQVAFTTAAYALVTLATGNAVLAFAAAVLGLVVGLQRRASGGVLGPIITHVAWSLTMLAVLPALFGG